MGSIACVLVCLIGLRWSKGVAYPNWQSAAERSSSVSAFFLSFNHSLQYLNPALTHIRAAMHLRHQAARRTFLLDGGTFPLSPLSLPHRSHLYCFLCSKISAPQRLNFPCPTRGRSLEFQPAGLANNLLVLCVRIWVC